MTAPNSQTTSLARSLSDMNSDALLGMNIPTAIGSANATVAAANLTNTILTTTNSANITLTTDTAANISTLIGGSGRPVNTSFQFTIQANAAANTAITLAAGTGVTITGNATITAGTSGTFAGVLTSATIPTFTVYRL